MEMVRSRWCKSNVKSYVLENPQQVDQIDLNELNGDDEPRPIVLKRLDCNSIRMLYHLANRLASDYCDAGILIE